MLHTSVQYPFWRTRPEDVDAVLDGAKKGETHTLCRSAGGRPIRYLTYGAREDYNRRANFSSACGAGRVDCYADRVGKRPTILIFGATHGQEVEGTAALINLISLLETGRDLRGMEEPTLLEAFREANCRLILMPVYNVDGRARCVPDSMLEEPPESLRHHGQGNWKDGSLCGWPECKMVHPILRDASFLGAYYNDDGVNLMHDNFFAPMAAETAAFLKLCDEEAPECAIGLHGGSNSTNVLLQPSYVPAYIRHGVRLLAESGAALAQARGLPVCVIPETVTEDFPPPSMNLTSAIFHVCGAVTSTYESNEGLKGPNAFTAEQILEHHYCLFESVLRCPWRTLEAFSPRGE